MRIKADLVSVRGSVGIRVCVRVRACACVCVRAWGTWSGRGQRRGGPSAHVGEGTVGLCAFAVVFTVGMDKQTLLPVCAVREGPANRA